MEGSDPRTSDGSFVGSVCVAACSMPVVNILSEDTPRQRSRSLSSRTVPLAESAVHVPGRAGGAFLPWSAVSPHRGSTEFAAAYALCVRRRGRRRRQLGRPGDRTVRAREGRTTPSSTGHLGHPGGRQRVLHGRSGSRSGGDRPQGSLLVALGWVTGCGRPGDRSGVRERRRVRRVEIGVLASLIAAMTFLAFALRHKLASGACSTTDSVLEALTDMPLETDNVPLRGDDRPSWLRAGGRWRPSSRSAWRSRSGYRAEALTGLGGVDLIVDRPRPAAGISVWRTRVSQSSMPTSAKRCCTSSRTVCVWPVATM